MATGCSRVPPDVAFALIYACAAVCFAGNACVGARWPDGRAILVRSMKRWAIFFGAVILVAGFTFVYLRLNNIPAKHTQSNGWYFGREWRDTAKEITPDPVLKRLIWHARLDHFVAPFPNTHRVLGPVIVQADGDEVYLVFPESLEGHNVVIYRASNSTRELLWKGEDSVSP